MMELGSVIEELFVPLCVSFTWVFESSKLELYIERYDQKSTDNAGWKSARELHDEFALPSRAQEFELRARDFHLKLSDSHLAHLMLATFKCVLATCARKSFGTSRACDFEVRARVLGPWPVSDRGLHRALANLAWELTVSHLALLALATFKYALATCAR
ncbi:hypothetical protein JCGZ_20264 [Jatropha curcas]|uniref:Uncharacterized protein n=1 Tax=Jatropha curcas TaxID=180498 RepID=A0A067JTW9_JATCU|nr:hypothetical protein JCGZ_20264 [Jatropha curcas]